jgi:hypothetical protein
MISERDFLIYSSIKRYEDKIIIINKSFESDDFKDKEGLVRGFMVIIFFIKKILFI